MSAQVVKLKPTRTGYVIPDDVLDDIRIRMYDWNAAELAEETKVSKSCIYAIRNGRTKWPRGATLFSLLDALDIEMTLVDARTGRPLR